MIEFDVPEAPALLSTEDRLALVSVRCELTVAALELCSRGRPASEILQRLAERLDCRAVVLLEATSGAVRVGASAGLSRRSLELPLELDPSALGPDSLEPSLAKLPYPELAWPGLVCWSFPMAVPPDGAPHALLLAFGRPPRLAHHLRRMTREQVLPMVASGLGFRRTLARLEERTALLHCESEASADGILVVSPKGTVSSVNRRFHELWAAPDVEEGCPAEGWIRHASRLLEDPGALSAQLLQAQGGGEVRGELALRDGRIFESFSAPIRSEGGTSFGRGWYFRDVTARKRDLLEKQRALEQERAARQQAESALRERDEFLSLASHELKTPLTGLALRLDMLKRTSSGPDQLGMVEKSQASLARLSKLINYLLDSTRVATGQLELRRVTFDLNRLVRETVAGYQASSQRHQVTLEESAAPVVDGDPMRLEQVITNLLENAIKYSPDGGEIRVHLGQEGDHAELTVSDPGVGIPAAQLPLLFRRFFRADNVRNPRFSGLGLGLYICRDIVERHGGRIWAESTPGHGTTMHVELPALPRTRGEVERPSEPASLH